MSSYFYCLLLSVIVLARNTVQPRPMYVLRTCFSFYCPCFPVLSSVEFLLLRCDIPFSSSCLLMKIIQEFEEESKNSEEKSIKIYVKSKSIRYAITCAMSNLWEKILTFLWYFNLSELDLRNSTSQNGMETHKKKIYPIKTKLVSSLFLFCYIFLNVQFLLIFIAKYTGSMNFF